MAGDKEIDRILKESIEIDKAEDEMYGDSTPYQMPKKLVNKAKRLEKIKVAKKKLEDEKLSQTLRRHTQPHQSCGV